MLVWSRVSSELLLWQALLTFAQPKQHETQHDKETPNSHQPSSPVAVEDGADLYADEEDAEQVDAEDPADLRRAVRGELVLREVRLEDGRRVDEPKDGQHGAEGARDGQPAVEAALRERQRRRRGGHARGDALGQRRGGPACVDTGR